jgi:hypothetical protein
MSFTDIAHGEQHILRGHETPPPVWEAIVIMEKDTFSYRESILRGILVDAPRGCQKRYGLKTFLFIADQGLIYMGSYLSGTQLKGG